MTDNYRQPRVICGLTAHVAGVSGDIYVYESVAYIVIAPQTKRSTYVLFATGKLW